MRIIIPMSGQGTRFKQAGYKTLKPLIEVDGKPVIEHVVQLFPGERDFTFICARTHLEEIPELRTILQHIAPDGQIIAIEAHKKGPVYAVAQMMDSLPESEEVIVNYCDFSCYWDYHDFLNHTRQRQADGAVPAYHGFHPHMLGTMNYAFMRDERQWMLAIKEKEPFTNNRMQEFASNGTYYFKKGAYIKRFFQELMDQNIHINGEFYVSLVFELMVRAGLKISIYEVQHMLQWGAPEDLEEYVQWSDYFRRASQPSIRLGKTRQDGRIAVIPMAGRGNRFIQEGYMTPKPLIEVSGKPMIVQATEALPLAEQYIFVCLKEHLSAYPLAYHLNTTFPGCQIVPLHDVTQGQACTVEQGVIGQNLDAPLLIGACDHGMVYDALAFEKLAQDETVHAIAFAFRHHPSSKRYPQMYGWLDVDPDLNVGAVSVKKPISEHPFEDHAIVGAFYFQKVRYFLESLRALYQKNVRINGEFYVDSLMGEMIHLGYRVKAFEVSHYLCWGTPNDLKTFEYWQSFFHKCNRHPYALNLDATVPKDKIELLDRKYRTFKQAHL